MNAYKLAHEFGATLISEESAGKDRQVFLTDLGVLKICEQVKDAKLEASALTTAQSIRSVRVPNLHDRRDTCLLMENVGRKPLETTDHFILAAKYLSRLHNSELTSRVRQELQEKGHCHYSRSSLPNRLQQEAAISQAAGFQLPWIDRFQNLVDRVVGFDLPSCCDVVGHGDPQASNFVLTNDGDVCAVDWHDFGLSNRWYEIAHFLSSIENSQWEYVVKAYRRESQMSLEVEWDSAAAYGRAVDCIIRAGSVARTQRAETRFISIVSELEKSVELCD